MAHRNLAFPGNELGRPKRHDGPGRYVQSQTAKVGRPRIHHSQGVVVGIAYWQAQNFVHGREIEHHLGGKLAALCSVEVRHAETARNGEARTGVVFVPAVLPDTGEDDILLQHLVPAKRVAP